MKNLLFIFFTLFILLPMNVNAQKLVVGFIYVGPIGDIGWSYTHEMARLELVKKYKDEIDAIYVENAKVADIGKVCENLIKQGAKIIFATSADFFDGVIEMAKKYPEIPFYVGGLAEKDVPNLNKRPKNVTFYLGKLEQAIYLTGIMAGEMTKTKTVGYLASKPIIEVIIHVNAFAKGVWSVDPKIKILVEWTGQWYMPERDIALAKKLVKNGADIFFIGTDSTAAVDVATENKVSAIGQYSDVSRFLAESVLVSAAFNWITIYDQEIKNYKKNISPSEAHPLGYIFPGFENGTVYLSKVNNLVPTELKKKIEKLKIEVETGKIVIFDCPLFNDKGQAVECHNGKFLSEKELFSMDYGIKGLDINLPKK
ncbi:MAG: BMP family ABC transporter substrate-binding protein [Oligoflexia bacterium]|nr:BMP family ABC transporter substrate-binding protein [Oligoflexia bacterium]